VHDPVELLAERAHRRALELRMLELEHVCRHFDGTTMTLWQYVQTVDGRPDAGQWAVVVDSLREMVTAYGPRDARGRGTAAI